MPCAATEVHPGLGRRSDIQSTLPAPFDFANDMDAQSLSPRHPLRREHDRSLSHWPPVTIADDLSDMNVLGRNCQFFRPVRPTDPSNSSENGASNRDLGDISADFGERTGCALK